MSVSSPFIHRPIATSLLGVAVMLGGFLGYWWLPVSALPQVDFPTIQVTTQLPGANPDTIAALVTAPLERQFGQIPALQTMTSSSSFGISQVTLQFDLNRDIDAAAQDVQSAINAAASTLPRNLPYPPLYSKVNPADAPIITLALTSQTIDLRALSDMLIVFVATIALTIGLYIKVPKGYFPQDDTGLIFGGTEASTDISFEAMKQLQQKAMDIVLADPAVAGLGSSVGASPFNASVNRGRLFISLKPLNERGNVTTLQVVGRLRTKLNQIPGIRVFMTRT